MTKLKYNEYVRQLGDEGMYRMLGNMSEVPTLEAARQGSDSLLESLLESSGLSKAKIRKAKYAIAQVTFHGANYLAFLYTINGTSVMLRATNLDTKKFYIPNDVWVVMTNRETDETELRLAMSLSMQELK